jgi:hypothetical protein
VSAALMGDHEVRSELDHAVWTSDAIPFRSDEILREYSGLRAKPHKIAN